MKSYLVERPRKVCGAKKKIGHMAGFKGRADYSVDSKGRVAIPAKMRNAMNPEANGAFTITRGTKRNIYLYPQDRWREMEEKLKEKKMYQRETEDAVRLLYMWADDVSLDSQGRVRIPESLKAFANITDRAVIIGTYDKIEIWNPETLEAHLNAQSERYETLAERVFGM